MKKLLSIKIILVFILLSMGMSCSPKNQNEKAKNISELERTGEMQSLPDSGQSQVVIDSTIVQDSGSEKISQTNEKTQNTPCPPPPYPDCGPEPKTELENQELVQKALKLKEGDYIRVKVLVSPDGEYVRHFLVKSSTPELEKRFEQAIKEAKFNPYEKKCCGGSIRMIWTMVNFKG